MAHCNLCNKNTRCSCKGGWCPGCGSSNKQISFLNDLLKFWIKKEDIHKDLNNIRRYEWQIDSYTMYEYLSEAITKEEFEQAVKDYLPSKKKAKANPIIKNEIADVTNKVNPGKKHKFIGSSAWARCEYCRGIRKYVEKEDCPAYKWEENAGSTDV